MNIYVGNLSARTTEEQLVDLFTPFGIVGSIKVIYDNYTGRSRGFAFVEMPEDAHAERAIQDLNNSSVDSQVIVVNVARPPVQRDRYPRSRY